MSNELQIILWAMGGGFGLMFALILAMWNSLSTRTEKLDEKLTDVDRRLCRLEGAFSSKDCCMLKDERLKQKAE